MTVYIVEWHNGMRVCASYHDAQCFRETLRYKSDFIYRTALITGQQVYVAPDSLTVPG